MHKDVVVVVGFRDQKTVDQSMQLLEIAFVVDLAAVCLGDECSDEIPWDF